MGSSRTRARTRVPCIGRRILNHCATREALFHSFLWLSLLVFLCVHRGHEKNRPRLVPGEGWEPEAPHATTPAELRPHWPSCLSCPATAWVTLNDCGFKLNSMELYHATVANQSDSKTKKPERVKSKIWSSLVKDKTDAQKRNCIMWNMYHNVPLGSGKKRWFLFSSLQMSLFHKFSSMRKKYFEKWNYLPDSTSSSCVWKKHKRGFILC